MLIESLKDVRPGDLFLGPIGGLVGAGVAAGEWLVDGGFRIGQLDVRHVGVVVEAMDYVGPELAGPFMVQAMPGGAEEIEMSPEKHWTPRCAYVRLEEDYPGQADDAAAIARLMVEHKVAYSPLSYLALGAWARGMSTPKLEAWINRRQEPVLYRSSDPMRGTSSGIMLPVEAICSVLADQAWSLTGKRIMVGVPHQCVTPSRLAQRLMAVSSDWQAFWSYPS